MGVVSRSTSSEEGDAFTRFSMQGHWDEAEAEDVHGKVRDSKHPIRRLTTRRPSSPTLLLQGCWCADSAISVVVWSWALRWQPLWSLPYFLYEVRPPSGTNHMPALTVTSINHRPHLTGEGARGSRADHACCWWCRCTRRTRFPVWPRCSA